MKVIENLKDKLSKYPHIIYQIEGNTLSIEPSDEKGFPITFSYHENEYTVSFGNWHGRFTSEEDVIDFIGLGLSKNCRLREVSRGGKAFRWTIESIIDGKWHTVYETAYLSLKFWEKPKEVIFQNNFI